MSLNHGLTSCKVRVLETIGEVRSWHDSLRERARAEDDRPVLGFVPTMGALHEGHMALMKEARKHCRHVIASIFVNPMQFGPTEDFGRYPRTFEKDLGLLAQEGVEAVFFPGEKEMYPEGKDKCTKVYPPAELADCLEGHFRPGFFVGVATVVNKLFSIVEPNDAFFGEKDYQQLLVVKRMVRDLDIPVTIHGVSTVREKDGLALSSRNVYLSEADRKLAPILHKTLCQVRDETLCKGSLQAALERGRKELAASQSVDLQYLEARHSETFEPLETACQKMVILLAAKIADVRLIDNVVVR
ncbi:MAG TPA: pantoate--beta-alanine ligase [Candidatus Obscuribacterales bacterium]